MDVSGKISQANGRLRASNVGVTVEQHGDKLYLRSTLPPKPGSDRTRPYQQRIALGVGAHPKGVSLAEAEARKVGALLDCGEFEWGPYLKDWGNLPQSVQDWLHKLEADFKPTVSEITWITDYWEVFKTLPPTAPLTPELLRQAIDSTEPNTRSRRRWVQALTKLGTYAGLEVDFKSLRGKYSASQVDPRSLPTDSDLASWREKITNPAWRWVYGMLCAFGLRNHEVFFLDTAELQAGKYWVTVLEGKTGPHEVWACFPEWVDLWNLREVQLPQVTGKKHSDYGDRVTHALRSDYRLPFTPLDIRHRWAVRTLECMIPVEVAARQMGHSVEVHTRTYHRSITSDTHQKVFELVMNRADRPKPPEVHQ